MSSSDSDNFESETEQPPPSKRLRSDTVETSSNNSVLQDSADERNDDFETSNFEFEQKKTLARRTVSYTDNDDRKISTLTDSSQTENSDDETTEYDSYENRNLQEKIPEWDSPSNGQTRRTSYESNKKENTNYGSSNPGFRRSSGTLTDSSQTENSDDEPADGRVSFASHSKNQSYKNNTEKSVFGEYSSKEDLSSLSAPQRMMKKMGWQEGTGLGKHGEGRLEPVAASTQKGRRGFGSGKSELGVLPPDFKWTLDNDPDQAEETVVWMPQSNDEPLDIDQLDEWLVKGPKRLAIDDETNFVAQNILKGVLNAKNIFDTLHPDDLRKARFRSNPYETIGSVCFLNRAAVKMANIDAICDFIFTEPKTADGQPLNMKNKLLYFADVCAGPGGFSEYVLFRKKWKAKGFGFTLKGANDFKLSDFLAGPPETFCPFYGVAEDGNIFNPENLTSLKDFVLKNTDGMGVHFLMGDGGFSVEAQENIQEILSKQLYLCQCLAALMLVRTGGHCVIKLFDVFTPFSVGLLYIMYKCFDKVCIHKPVTSRPANSERYLICLFKRSQSNAAEQHLEEVNSYLWDKRNTESDVTSLVPLDVIKADSDFYDYIYNSNCILGKQQILNLLKIAEFCKQPALQETRQIEIKKQCLELWKLLDVVRKQPEKLSADDCLNSILNNLPVEKICDLDAFKLNTLGKEPVILKCEKDLGYFKNPFMWHFKFLGGRAKGEDCGFFLGTGGTSVYKLKGKKWTNVILGEYTITLPANTLVYGEIVNELVGEGKGQRKIKAFHVIDAVCLGGVSVSHINIIERQEQCQMFCDALDRSGSLNAMSIRCKKLFAMEDFEAMDLLEIRHLKSGLPIVTVTVQNRKDSGTMFHEVDSIVFYRSVKEPWCSAWSKSRQCNYFWRLRSNKEQATIPKLDDSICMDSIGAHKYRIIWQWTEPLLIFKNQNRTGLTRMSVDNFIRQMKLK